MTYNTGVYKIVNKIDKKVYYGSAQINFISRWNKHKSNLKNNVHDNLYLQRAYNKYGADAFEFSIVIECPPEKCLSYEQIYLDMYWDNCINCYNIAPTAGSQFGFVHSDESREKISQSKTGKQPNFSIEELERRRQRMLGNTNTLGMKQTEEMCYNKSIIMKKSARRGKEHPNFGKAAYNRNKPMSNEQKQKISNANTGKKHTAETRKK